jgi:peroxiredoxin Q/BCP
MTHIEIVGYPRLMTRTVLALSLLLATSAATAEDLIVGAKAPEFSLSGSDGKTHSLAQHVGKQGVVLAWFPKAFTPG